MRRKSMSTVAVLAAALATCSLAEETRPAKHARLAQLHIRLLGVSQ